MTIEEQLKGIILSKYKSLRAFCADIDIPYSTMDSALKRGIGGMGVTVALKVFGALGLDPEGLSTGELRFRVDETLTVTITDRDPQLMQIENLCTQMTADGMQRVIEYAEDLLHNPKYQKK